MPTSVHNFRDFEMRLAAAQTLARLSRVYGDAVPWDAIGAGFWFKGQRIRLASRPVGVFKPAEMDRVLSIKTVVPKAGRQAQYSDQMADNAKHGMWVYDMRGGNPSHTDNQWLKTAWEEHLPLIYLRGLAPAVYLPLFPVHVTDWDASAGQVRLVLGLECTASQDLVQADAFGGPLSSYTYRRMEDRLARARFRMDILKAYQETCTFSGLSRPQLVDAVPIVTGANGDSLDVTGGLCMSRLHHAAFEANLLGIDPDGRIHVSGELGPFQHRLMSLAGHRIVVPRIPEFQPNRDLLAVRFEQFLAG